MKKMMKRTLSLSLCLLLLLSALLLPCFAQEGDFVDFSKSADSRRVSGGGVDYYWYDPPIPMYLMPDTYYNYQDTLTINDELCEIRCAASYREVIFLCPESEGFYIYATEQGKTYMDEFFNERKHVREYAVYTDAKSYAAVSDGFLSRVEGLKNNPEAEKKAFSGATLERSEKADLGARDSYRAYMARYGMIYTLSDGYYYLDRASFGEDFYLPDVYTASEPIELLKLDDALADEYNEALRRATPYYVDNLYEEYTYDVNLEKEEKMSEQAILVLFWIVFVILGFVIPCVGLVFGLLLPRSARLKRPRHWYALAIVCGVWILIALAAMITVLAVMV